MRKTGIITFHRASSYGAVMQSLALQKAVESLGSEVEIINYHSPGMSQQKPIFSEFCDKHLRMTKFYSDAGAIEEKQYDAVITGSDQVWNTNLIKDPAFFLSFVKGNAKKIAYSASVGINKELSSQLDEKMFADYIPEFDSISVRERVHVPYVQQFAKGEVCATIDPVFLLQSEDYDQLFGNDWEGETAKKDRGKYIFYHGVGLSAKLVDFLNLLSAYSGYPVIAITDYEKYHFGRNTTIMQNVPPEKWVSYIKNAELVLTNSYHTMLFAILYGVPFYAYTAKQHANVTRLLEVLDTLGLHERKLMNVSGVSKTSFEMDYTKAYGQLREKREYSYEYLRNAIMQ